MNKLDTVNFLLRKIGEAPVNDIGSEDVDVLHAVDVLDDVSAEIQAKPRWYNTDDCRKLLPDQSGEVILPSNTLEVRKCDPFSHIVQRGGRLYDTEKGTFNIGCPVFVDLTLHLEFDELPQVVKTLIRYKAAADFVDSIDGDEQTIRRLERQAVEAEIRVNAAHIRAVRSNVRTSPGFLNVKSGVRPASRRLGTDPRYAGGG